MCVSKVQHVTGRKTGCNRSRPVFFGFSIFWQTSQLATKKIQNLCNRNRWSGLLRLGSVRFRSFFQSSELDLRTLDVDPGAGRSVNGGSHWEVDGTDIGLHKGSIKGPEEVDRQKHIHDPQLAFWCLEGPAPHLNWENTKAKKAQH